MEVPDKILKMSMERFRSMTPEEKRKRSEEMQKIFHPDALRSQEETGEDTK